MSCRQTQLFHFLPQLHFYTENEVMSGAANQGLCSDTAASALTNTDWSHTFAELHSAKHPCSVSHGPLMDKLIIAQMCQIQDAAVNAGAGDKVQLKRLQSGDQCCSQLRESSRERSCVLRIQRKQSTKRATSEKNKVS